VYLCVIEVEKSSPRDDASLPKPMLMLLFSALKQLRRLRKHACSFGYGRPETLGAILAKP